MTTFSPILKKSALLLALLAGLSACGQKGPLIVEKTDPFATEALQEEAGEVQAEVQE